MTNGGVASASSGTAALVGAILAVAGRASPGRPIAVLPAFTFVATATAAEMCGYRPYLADIDPASWMLDPARLAEHPDLDKIGLVIPVAPFGRPVPQEPWRIFRERTGIPVAIDGAASFDCVIQQKGGYLGEIPIAMSFHATKCFATGEGGAVVSSDASVVARSVQALNFGFHGTRECHSAHINGKMSEYHAAVGLAELDGWAEKWSALQVVTQRYRSNLAKAGFGDRLIAAPEISASYLLCRCESPSEAGHVQEHFKRSGVDFRLWYGKGLQDHAYFSHLPRGDLAVSERVAPCLIGMPTAPDLSDQSISRVVAALAEGLSKAAT